MTASTKFFGAIPDVGSTEDSVRIAVQAIKANVEVLTKQNAKAKSAAAVTYQDLVDLGLIKSSQIPT